MRQIVVTPRHILLLLTSLSLLAASACAESTSDLPERDDPDPIETVVEEPIEFTGEQYPASLSGPNTIAELTALIDFDEFVWTAFSPETPYPVQGDCDFSRNGEQSTFTVDELPMEIQGVVTYHPRHFYKPATCGSDERFYGSFVIQDGTDGIFVLRDSRISPFSYGDVVKMRVTGLVKFFDTYAILTHDNLEVVEGEKRAIWFDNTSGAFTPADYGQVRRIRGEIISEATNNNFNEMEIQSLDDPTVTWLASLDRELGQRRPELGVGTRVQLTGPVIDSFGLRMLVASFGQIERLD